MPKNVLDGLIMTGRAGFMTRKIWREFFGNGDLEVTKKQIKRLLAKGYLSRHPNPIAKHVLVLTSLGKDFLLDKLESFSTLPLAGQLSHDELVLWSILRLTNDGIIADCQFENELKCATKKSLFSSSKYQFSKYPDAAFKILVNDSPKNVALEYERQRKSPERYRDILWLYAGMENLSLIIFICETQVIMDCLKRQIKRIGDPELGSRIALVSAKNWLTGPLSAPLQMSTETYLLKNICEVWQSNSLEKGVP